jgi:hypothetical protein
MPIGSYWTLDGTPPAATTACLAPEKAGADGRRCPYREHVLKSLQGHGTWEVLVACRGQQRFTPNRIDAMMLSGPGRSLVGGPGSRQGRPPATSSPAAEAAP